MLLSFHENDLQIGRGREPVWYQLNFRNLLSGLLFTYLHILSGYPYRSLLADCSFLDLGSESFEYSLIFRMSEHFGI